MIKHIYKILSLVALTTLLLACRTERTTEQSEMMVTIAPLKYLVEQITCGDFEVGVLVPANASPETFDPTPRQIIELNDSKMLFSTGLIEFEQALIGRLEGVNVIDLSQGIDLIEGHHHHKEEEVHHQEEHHHKGHSHTHGIDPHIWTSPIELRQMARNAYEAIIATYPDSVHYTKAYDELDARIASLDKECKALCEASDTKAFVIYHPALSYLARAYSLEQIAVEEDGKEPSARHIANVIDQARTKRVHCLLYQTQFPRSTVEVIANDIGIQPQVFDPLKEDVFSNIRTITHYITASK